MNPHHSSNRPNGGIGSSLPKLDLVDEPKFDEALAAQLIARSVKELPPQLPRAEAALSTWIFSLLGANRERFRSMESFGFARLRSYFPEPFLERTMVRIVPRCPDLPLVALGVHELDMPSGAEARGITFRNNYFIAQGSENSDRLHFHEAVHAVQWMLLGERGFLLTYAAGLVQGGYAGNPLEILAYTFDSRYAAGGPPFDVVKEVRASLCELARCRRQ